MMYIANSFKTVGRTQRERGHWPVDNDPHFWSSPPTWGICRPDLRKKAVLGQGSVIQPGNWGRVIALHTNATPVIYRETILESVRRASFPTKPSRLTSFFALESLPEAMRYRNQHAATNLIYEVAVECDPASVHRGSYDNTQDFRPPIMQNMQMFAEQYWSAVATEAIEVFCEKPATIVRRVG
ncbi:DUF2441 domain-containing protein [Variovorax gossypii]